MNEIHRLVRKVIKRSKLRKTIVDPSMFSRGHWVIGLEAGSADTTREWWVPKQIVSSAEQRTSTTGTDPRLREPEYLVSNEVRFYSGKRTRTVAVPITSQSVGAVFFFGMDSLIALSVDIDRPGGESGRHTVGQAALLAQAHGVNDHVVVFASEYLRYRYLKLYIEARLQDAHFIAPPTRGVNKKAREFGHLLFEVQPDSQGAEFRRRNGIPEDILQTYKFSEDGLHFQGDFHQWHRQHLRRLKEPKYTGHQKSQLSVQGSLPLGQVQADGSGPRAYKKKAYR